MTPLGAKLRAMREERGVTLKDMAASLRVSSAYLSALEHGHRGKPTWILLQRMIAYFNVIWDEAEELFRCFMGRGPDVGALIRRNLGPAPDETEPRPSEPVAR